VKILRAILLALLLSFLVGVAIGTLLRRRAERPVRYIGAIPVEAAPTPLRSTATPGPLDVADARTLVLGAGEHEEQIG
jgi:hypothetical protein